MRKWILLGFCSLFFFSAFAQIRDTTVTGSVTVITDPRIAMLGKKMADYNTSLSLKVHSGKGYRLMVLSTSDREFAMHVRSQLYQLFPDQKQYMSYQMPNIKIKLGNFENRDDAVKLQKQLAAMKLVPGNIYILPEQIEIKPDKKDTDRSP